MSLFGAGFLAFTKPGALLFLKGSQLRLQLSDLVQFVLAVLPRVHRVPNTLCTFLVRHIDKVDLRSIFGGFVGIGLLGGLPG